MKCDRAFKKNRLHDVLFCFFILVFFVLSGSLGAEPGEVVDKTGSPYFFVKSDDPETDRLPLKSTTVDVSISGVIADVTVLQVYKNEGSRPIEAIYIFPSSTKAAVYGMKMQVGERTIVAKVKERQKARQEYQEARDAGKSASLLEQHRPNVFQMSVANILPRDVIKVELKYTELLEPADAVYEFVYPTVVGPRYVGGKGDSSGSETWTANPYLQEGELPATTFDIGVNLHAGLPIQEISCGSHRVVIDYKAESEAFIKLDSSESRSANRDYILKYRLAGGKIETGLLLYEGEEENFFLLMMQPPRSIKPSSIVPRDYMFIVDVSGSMNGFPLAISKKLLKDLIGNLRPIDRFNVLLFSGGSTVMSERSVPATRENIDKALAVIDCQRGGGGTVILPALKRALEMPGTEGYSRNIIIATDGYVCVETGVFDLIRRSLGDANIFTFGIGSSVNHYLIEGMARVGMGEPFVITHLAEAEAKARKFRKLIESPVLTNITIDYRGFDAYDIEPLSIPDIMAERPVIVFGKYRNQPMGNIYLRGKAGESIYEKVIDVSQTKPSPGNSALRYLWARHRIALLADYNSLSPTDERKQEVTSLGLTYNLLTAFTSFVAVDHRERRTDGKAITVKQPLPLPQGVSNLAVSGVSGSLCSSVTVSGKVGVIDVRKTQVGVAVCEETLDAIPSSGNFYAALQLAPGVSTNTEGINERAPSSGSHLATSRGQVDSANNTWNLDGLDITDPGDPGSPTAMLDINSFEEVDIKVGGGEISNQTGTVNLNFVTKSGGNQHRFDFRYFLTHDALGAKVNEDTLLQRGIVNANDINDINEYGISAAGPILKDRFWYWFSLGSSKVNAFTRADVDTLSTAAIRTYDLKLNLRAFDNHTLTLYLHADDYKGEAEDISAGYPEGYLRKNLSSLGNPIIRLQDNFIMGNNLMVDLKYAYISSGSRTVPMIDPDYEQMIRINEAAGTRDTSYGAYYKNRKKHVFSAHLNYFMENFLNVDHEMLLNFEYQQSHSSDEIRTADPLFASPEAFMTYNWATSQFNVDGLPGYDIPVGWEKLSLGRHWQDRQENLNKISLGFQDTVMMGRWTLMLALRYDRYQPSLHSFSLAGIGDQEMNLPRYRNYFEQEVLDLIREWMPALDIPAHSGKGYAVSIFSPRVGVTWDIGGDGRNALKFAVGLYGDIPDAANARYLMPYGAESGLQFWLFRDAPGKYTLNDLYWTDFTTGTPVQLFTGTTGTWRQRLNPALNWDQLLGYNAGPSFQTMYYGFPLGTGTALPNRYEIDDNARTSRRIDATLSFEREIISDFSLGINFNYSQNYNFPWECAWFKNGDGAVINGPQYYEAAGTIPGSIAGIPRYNPGEAAGREWYAINTAYQGNPEGYIKIERRPDYYREYKAIDIMFNKRFSDNWQLDGSITFQDIKQHFGEAGYLNGTNLWALDGKTYGSLLNNVSSRWLVKLTGLYRIVYGLDLSFLFTAREGNLLVESFAIKDERPATGHRYSGDILMYEMGKKRLPAFYQLNLGLEKTFRISDKMEVCFSADCFNVFNRTVEVARSNLNYGTLVIKPDNSYQWEPNTNPHTNGNLKQVLSPRIFRFGVRFIF